MAVSNMNLIHALVSQLHETQALSCGGYGGGCGWSRGRGLRAWSTGSIFVPLRDRPFTISWGGGGEHIYGVITKFLI